MPEKNRYTDEGTVAAGCKENAHSNVYIWKGSCKTKDGEKKHSGIESKQSPYCGLEHCSGSLKTREEHLPQRSVCKEGRTEEAHKEKPPCT